MSHSYRSGSSEWRLPVPGGQLAGLESHGEGPDVLFVHSHGFSAMTWSRVLEHLPDMHCVALDLRGHGQSDAPLLDAHEGWRDVAHVVESLGLDAPVLVGHDTGAFAVLATAADQPGLASAVVAIDGDLHFTPRVQIQADLDWAQTPEVRELIRERFFFGHTMSTEQECEELVATLTRMCVHDWLLEGVDETIEAEVRRSIVAGDDGTWLHVPSVEAAVIGYRIDIDAKYYPQAELYEQIVEPLHLVRYLRSANTQDRAPYLELAGRLANMSIHEIDGGHLAHYSHAAEVADIVRVAAGVTSPTARQTALLPPEGAH